MLNQTGVFDGYRLIGQRNVCVRAHDPPQHPEQGDKRDRVRSFNHKQECPRLITRRGITDALRPHRRGDGWFPLGRSSSGSSPRRWSRLRTSSGSSTSFSVGLLMNFRGQGGWLRATPVNIHKASKTKNPEVFSQSSHLSDAHGLRPIPRGKPAKTPAQTVSQTGLKPTMSRAGARARH